MPRQVAEKPARGILSYEQGPREFYPPGVMVARLIDPTDSRLDVLPAIDNAKIERLRGFVQIRGIEYFKKSIKSRTDRYEQSWLCCQSEEEGLRLMLIAEGKRRTGKPLTRPVDYVTPRPVRLTDPDPGLTARIAAIQAEEDERIASRPTVSRLTKG